MTLGYLTLQVSPLINAHDFEVARGTAGGPSPHKHHQGEKVIEAGIPIQIARIEKSAVRL